MSIITEEFLRSALRNKQKIILKKTDVLSPLARDFVRDKRIKIEYESDGHNDMNTDKTTQKNPENIDFREQRKVVFRERVSKDEDGTEEKYKYVTIFGTKLNYKPEHMTHLRGATLVFKDHKQIIFRGKMDTLESKILEAQIHCQQNGKQKLVDDLQELLIFVRLITRAEVLDTKLDEMNLLGLGEQQIREMSHYPKKYFNIGHEFPDYRMGDLVVYVNSIRAFVREVEISAYTAFKNEYGEVSRNDIIQALNRISSVCWIIMFKIRIGDYD